MLSFILKRVLATVPVMGVVALIVFLLLRLSPGDPAAVIAGDYATAEQIEKIRTQLGLNQPILVQFISWLGDLARGDLGVSIFSNLPVSTLIAQRIEPTLMLAFSVREEPYVEAAIAAGTRLPLILIRHVLPNCVPALIVQATYVCASAMLTEAILSFLGAGTPPEIPSWGNMMADGRAFFPLAPRIILFPGAALALMILAVNVLGDGLRDRLDPKLARRV
jgi:ABC-type dipeptide/oligopeptide/nickel transport system permease subunit